MVALRAAGPQSPTSCVNSARQRWTCSGKVEGTRLGPPSRPRDRDLGTARSSAGITRTRPGRAGSRLSCGREVRLRYLILQEARILERIARFDEASSLPDRVPSIDRTALGRWGFRRGCSRSRTHGAYERAPRIHSATWIAPSERSLELRAETIELAEETSARVLVRIPVCCATSQRKWARTYVPSSNSPRPCAVSRPRHEWIRRTRNPMVGRISNGRLGSLSTVADSRPLVPTLKCGRGGERETARCGRGPRSATRQRPFKLLP